MVLLTWKQFISKKENKKLPIEEAKIKYKKDAYEFERKAAGIANWIKPVGGK